MQIQFREGIEGPVRILNGEKYERTFEGSGPFDVEPDEWNHLKTVMTNVLEPETLGSLGGGDERVVNRAKSVFVFEPVDQDEPESPIAAAGLEG